MVAEGREIVYSLSDAQYDFLASEKKLVGFIGAIGSGKAQPVDCPVLTPMGWCPIGMIRPGDKVIGQSGDPVSVVSVHPQGVRAVYRITFADYTSTRCCGEHIWRLFSWDSGKWELLDTMTVRQRMQVEDERLYLPEIGVPISYDDEAIDDSCNRYVIDVEPAGEAECVCIAVDSPDGLYVTENHIVTHNTWILARWIAEMVMCYPGSIGLIGANTYKQLAQSTLPHIFAALYDIGLQHGRDFVWNRTPSFGYRSKFPPAEHDGILSFANGTQIVTRTLDNYEAIRGIEIDWAGLDETRDTAREAFDVVMGRMRGKIGPHRMRVVTSPAGFNWLHAVFVEEVDADNERPENEKKGLARQREYFNASIYDNRQNLPEGYIESLEAQYDEVFALQELHGKWVSVGSGRAYIFERAAHTFRSGYYEAHDSLYLTCDFNTGGESPQCWIVAQHDRDGILRAIDEIVLKSPGPGMSITETAARVFLDRYGKHQGFVEVFGDYYGSSRATNAALTDYQLIARILRPTFGTRLAMRVRADDPNSEGGNPRVILRVSQVNALFRNVHGESRCAISDRCVTLIRDFDGVTWKEYGVIDKRDKSLTHACFPAGQMVDTTSGPKPIEHITAGDELVSPDGEPSVVLGAGCTGLRPLVRVTLEDGRTITCTPDHPFAVPGDGWRRADQMQGVATCSRPAQRLVGGIRSTPVERRRIAPEVAEQGPCIVSVESVEPDFVYSLATTAGTYFVNGTLVSNCDAWGYLVHSVAGRKIRDRKDVPRIGQAHVGADGRPIMDGYKPERP
jgi:hypothetical protein